MKQTEIKYPLYRKSKCHAYKVLSKDNCIIVCHGLEDMLRIEIGIAELAFHSDTVMDCTRFEFETLYTDVYSKLGLMATL